MKKVGFIGACDKTNLIVYVAKLLEIVGKRVIVVDTTKLQKMKYLVPSISPTKSYVTDFADVDFAVGFSSINDLTDYLEIEEENLPYDYMLIDIDHDKMVESFEIENTKTNYFVTSFDMYSLQRGVEILKNFMEPMNLSKILCDYHIDKEDEDYLNYLSMDTKIGWNELSIYMPVTGYDKQIIEENQRLYRIRMKKLSPQYLEGIIYIVQDIIQDLNINKIKKMIKE
jgi:hypothetical protein